MLLVIEDDSVLVEWIRRTLKDEPIRIVHTLEGESGIALARRQRPDLIFMGGTSFPGKLSHKDILQGLTTHPNTQNIPILHSAVG